MKDDHNNEKQRKSLESFEKAGKEVEEATELANVSSLRTGKPGMKARVVVPSVTCGMII